MRKTFKFICAAVVAAFAVSSCYDDALVWDELDKHAGEIAGLEERVAALETKLNSEVAAINKVVSTLQGNVTALQGDVKDLTAADAELLSKLNGLSSEDKKLTDALAGLQAVVDAMAEPVDSLADVTTAIQESIKEALEELDALDGTVDGAVTDFEKALATLEKTLKDADAANLAAVQAAIAALDVEGLAEELDGVSADLAAAILTVAVVDVEKLDNGDIVLTLKDNTTLTIPAKDENANNESLVTTVTENGVAYWAVVGEDGEATAIVDGEGNKIPVGHPIALEFRMGDSGTLEYSTDGGQTFTDTGLSASVPDLTVAVVKDFVDNGSYVSMTIGGVAVNLPKYVVETVNVQLSRTSMFVGFGTSKDVEITTEGVSEAYVMTKPDGWKATITNNTLTVTAPLASAAEVGAIETSGEILIHLTTNTGKCKIVKLDVKTGKRFDINIDSTTGGMTIFNSVVFVEEDLYGPLYTFGDASVGIVSVETFEQYASFDEFIENIGSSVEPLRSCRLNNILRRTKPGSEEPLFEGLTDYIPLVSEELTLTTNLYDFWDVAGYFTLVEGEQYVVYAIPEEGNKILTGEAVYCYYQPTYINVTSTPTWNDLTLSLELKGADEYWIGYAPKADLDLQGVTIDQYLQNQMMSYTYMGYEGLMMVPMQPFNDGEEISLYSDLYCPTVLPGNEYYVFVFPYKDGMTPDNFDYEKDLKPYIFTFATSTITEDTENISAPTVSVSKTYFKVSAELTFSEGCTVYYDYLEGYDINDDESDDEIFNAVLATDYLPLTESGSTNSKSTTPGSEYVFATITISADGKYRLDKTLVEIPDYPEASSNITITNINCVKNQDESHTVTVTVSGNATKLAVYYIGNTTSASSVKEYILKDNTRYVPCVDITDGSASYTFAANNVKTHFYLCAFKKNDDGTVEWSDVVIKSFAEYDTPTE